MANQRWSSEKELERNTVYRWTVKPLNSAGETCADEPATWEFRTAPHPPPCAPRLVNPPEGSCAYEDTVQVAWTCDAGPDPVTYAVFRSPWPGDPPPPPDLLAANELTGKTAAISGLVPGTYAWRVAAMDLHYPRPETGTSSSVGSFRICPPDAPTGLTVTAQGPLFTLSWRPAAGATSYAVFVSPSPGIRPTSWIDTTKETELPLADPLAPGEYLMPPPPPSLA